MLVYTIIIVYIQVASTVLTYCATYIEDATGDACKYRYTLCHTTA